MLNKKIIIACGGTGGHVFPGLAVANELKRRGHQVEVWLSGRSIETAAQSGWDGDTFATGARQLSLRNLPHMIRAFFRCLKAIKKRRPDVLLAMGSYSSLPPVLAAWLNRIPIVLHEANAVPGKAVTTLARFAHTIATSFDETANWLPHSNVVKTGLPVRETLCSGAAVLRPDSQATHSVAATTCSGEPVARLAQHSSAATQPPFTIFITGGSQGAHRVNQLTAQAMCLLKQADVNDFFVIHQTGVADEATVRETYEKAGVPSLVSAFITDMGRAYASADFVIARAGASTCFELCLLGKPALLIPLPSAVRDHQQLNATALARTGGANVGRQQDLTGRTIMRYILNKKNNPGNLKQMSQALKTLSPEDAAGRVAQVIEGI